MSSVRQAASEVVRSATAGLADATSGSQLFAVANLLEATPTLRRGLADSGVPQQQRLGLVADVLSATASAQVVSATQAIVGARWSSDSDLVDGIEQAGALVILAQAEADGTVEVVENEIFYFARLVDSQAELAMALSDPARSASAKAALVTDLLSGQANPATVALVAQFVSHLRGRRVGASLDALSALAAIRRGRIVATVTSAIALSEAASGRIGAALARIYGRDVQVDTEIDPSVIGGVRVRIGDDVIDGTIASRLAEAGRAVLS
jgi:F-type H+-transporting ATPase subunit delta